VKLLHKIKVPGFPTIELIDNIVNAVIGSLYCVTEDEAGNLSIFLNEIWKSVNSWRYDNDAFASELKNWVSSERGCRDSWFYDYSLSLSVCLLISAWLSTLEGLFGENRS
jgi:hypothetical protein